MNTPEQLRQVGQKLASLLLPVPADALGVVQVVALLAQCLHQSNVLKKPVARLVVTSVAARTTIVVATVLQKHAEWFLFGLSHQIGVGMTSAEVGEAADDAENLAELVGALPCNSKGRYCSGTCAANATAF